jgi:uncharacterized cupredoxin-like copper-binding protein
MKKVEITLPITKKELLKYEKYFTCPKMILEIYKDEEVIPKNIVKLMFHVEEPKEYQFRCSPQIYAEITKKKKNY